MAPITSGPLPSIVPDGSWVVVKPNMVFLRPQTGYCQGDITDPRVTRAVLEYVAEFTQARRITLAMGGSWQAADQEFTTGLNFTGIVSQDDVRVDGWTSHFGDDYPGFTGTFQDLLDDLGTRHPDKTFDRGNFNYDLYPSIDDPQLVPVPVSNGIGGWSNDSYYVSNMVLNSDVFITVPTMKPHNEARLTLGHKNYVGTASRLMYNRGNWWNAGLHNNPRGVDGSLVDLFSYHPADYTIIGGAWGLDGQGPHKNSRSGPIRTNMIIAGWDPVATDAVAAEIMGYNPWDIEHLRMSAAKGHGVLDMNYITVRGDAIADVGIDYRKSENYSDMYYGRANRTWLIHGVHEGADLDVDFLGGENEVAPFDGEAQNGAIWTRVISDYDQIDLKNFFHDRDGIYHRDVVAYAFTYIHSATRQEAELWIGSDDGVKVWLNGEEVWSHPMSGSHRIAEDRVPVVLDTGENRLLVKVKNDLGGYAMSLLVSDGDGDTAPGIRYHTEMPASTAITSTGAAGLPDTPQLAQNFPNPFNGGTTIRYSLSESEPVDLSVYNLQGQKVATLEQEVRGAGAYAVRWGGLDDDGRSLASGTYLYRLRAGTRWETRKLLLLR